MSMERRFKIRLGELRRDAEVHPNVLKDVLPRLEAFLDPFVAVLPAVTPRDHVACYVEGLLSDLDGKDAESIAYLHDQDRQGLQKFIGQTTWDHQPLVKELVRQVGAELGEADGVLVFDPSAFPKKGTESVGVQRQWCGRLGKIENCQVGIYLGYVSRHEHALVAFRLFLPQEWAERKRRRAKAGVPEDVSFRTRHELMLDMLDEHGTALPHAWVAGDDELGRSSGFRQDLRQRNEQYLLAVPSNTLVRVLAAQEPPATPGGRPRQAPFTRVDRWCAAVPEPAWQTIEVRPGEKGPLIVQAIATFVETRTEGRVSGTMETLVVFREQQRDGTWKHDYLLSNAWVTTPLSEFARVFKAMHRIEECLQRAKSEAGLADYQVRTWHGWHHHQTLALLATWFLTKETRRGKNLDPRADRAPSAQDDRPALEWPAPVRSSTTHSPHDEPALAQKRNRPSLPLAPSQPLAATKA
jgi:SRSO17 transposase